MISAISISQISILSLDTCCLLGLEGLLALINKSNE